MRWAIHLSDHFTAIRLVCCEYDEFVSLITYAGLPLWATQQGTTGILLLNLNRENNL
jgi:hypothetical protein